jgi:hypothetical protein
VYLLQLSRISTGEIKASSAVPLSMYGNAQRDCPLLINLHLKSIVSANSHALATLKEKAILGTVLLVVLVLALLGVLPVWPHAKSWGYGPSGGVGLVLVIILILFLRDESGDNLQSNSQSQIVISI